MSLKKEILIVIFFFLFTAQAFPNHNQKLLALHFKTGSHTIQTVDKIGLEAFASRIKEGKGRFLLVGHTDERGSNQYNLMLGDKRARSVLRYFVEAGLDADRFLILSKGETEPIDPSHHPAAWKKNRRVEIFIW